MSNSRKYRRNRIKNILPKIWPVSDLPDNPEMQAALKGLQDTVREATGEAIDATHYSMPKSVK